MYSTFCIIFFFVILEKNTGFKILCLFTVIDILRNAK